MKRLLFICFILIFGHQGISAQSLNAGDIAFIGYNTDASDAHAFITLTNIPGNEEIYFTDQGLLNSTTWMPNGEDHWLFTAPLGGIPCGTVVTITDAPIPTITGVTGASLTWLQGSVTNNYNLSAGDQMIAYQVSTPGVPASPSTATFIAAVHGDYNASDYNPSTTWNNGGAVNVSSSVVPPGLTNGVNCVSLFPAPGPEMDNAKYSGSLVGTSTVVRAAIHNPANWTFNDAAAISIQPGDYSPGITCVSPCNDPDVPSNLSATPATICPGATSTISWTGNLNDATHWSVYTTSCGTGLLTTTTSNSLVVSPSSTTTYYIRGEGGCVTPGSCGQVTVTVGDVVNPTISCPGNQTGSVNASCNFTLPDYTSLASANDNCTSSPSVTQSPMPGTVVGVGTTIVTLTATDGASNIANCNFNVVVSDNINPTISCPGNQTENPNASCQFILPDYTSLASANDNCTASPSVSQSPVPGTIISGNTTITLTATDGSSNTAQCTFDVILNDVTSPTAVCQNVTIYLDGLGNATITAGDIDGGSTDNCSSVNLVASKTSFSCSDLGTNNVTLTVTDGNSNTDNCVAVVTVMDTISPAISCPGNQTETATSACQFSLPDYTGLASASDNCTGSPSITQSPAIGTMLALGNHIVTLTADDGNGNTSQCSFTVAVSSNITGSQTLTECDGFSITVGSNTYTTTGVYTDTLTGAAANGCDSIHTTNLTVLSPLTGTVNNSICNGDSIIVNGNVYNVSTPTGTEVITNVGPNNCDSTVTVNLNITTVDVSTITNNDTITANATGAIYQWLDCNNNYTTIGGETNQMFIVSNTGSYAVEITQNGCVDTSNCENIIITGLNTLDNNDVIKVYPNPTKGVINVGFKRVTEKVNYKLISIDGRLIDSGIIFDKSIKLNLMNESKGLYFLEIKNDIKITRIKIIKQ